jgi:hypothetical protein
MMRFKPALLLTILTGTVLVAGILRSEGQDAALSPSTESAPDGPKRARRLPSVEEARERAELLHDLANELLRAIHQAYYREDEGLPIPALLLRDVFHELGKRHQVEFRWLAVDADAMNVDHRPRTDFEKEAAKALIAGKTTNEETANGVLRHIGIVPLTSECLKCHLPNRRSTKTRAAGLMITIPVRPE